MYSDFSMTCIINVKNGELYIRETIDSILEQTLPVHLVVVDNMSIDSTRAICESYKNLRYEIVPYPMTLGDARNYSLQFASGKFVTWLDADDLWKPHFVEKIAQAISGLNEVTIACTGYETISESGSVISEIIDHTGFEDKPSQIIKYRKTKSAWLTYVFKLEALKEIGGIDPMLTYAPDFDIVLKLSDLGSSLYIPENLASYRVHPDQFTKKTRSSVRFQESEDIILRFLHEKGRKSPIKTAGIKARTRYLIARSESIENGGIGSFASLTVSLLNPFVYPYLIRRSLQRVRAPS